LGVSQALIGLTVVALGTSLPELATAVVASLKNEDDLAVGGIMGSNIFNVFLVLGITAVITPLHFDPMLLFDALFALFVVILFYLLLLRKKSLSRFDGAFLIFLYVLYIVSVTFRETLISYFGG